MAICQHEWCDNTYSDNSPANRRYCNTPDCIKLGAIKSRQAHLELYGKKCVVCTQRIPYDGPPHCSKRCEITDHKNQTYTRKLAIREHVRRLKDNDPIQMFICGGL